MNQYTISLYNHTTSKQEALADMQAANCFAALIDFCDRYRSIDLLDTANDFLTGDDMAKVAVASALIDSGMLSDVINAQLHHTATKQKEKFCTIALGRQSGLSVMVMPS